MRKSTLLLFLLTFLLFSCREKTMFKLMDPDRTGIHFSNTITESEDFNVLTYEYIYNGAGVGAGDLNGDSLPDLVFAGNQVSPAAYLNEGNFRFREITSNFKGLSNDQWYSSVSVVDINNDRLNDVYLTSTKDTDPDKCRNRLWINQGNNENGDPVFSEMAAEYGIDYNGQSVTAAFLDYDLDGFPDLYILNNTVTQRMNTNYRPKITDGSAGNNDRLFHNNGNGTFTDVTHNAGIVFEGFGLGLAIGDVNKDGYPDIYVSNDYISNDLLYINQRDGTFKNEIRKYMSYQTKSSMGNDMADLDNDGNPEMYTLDMLPEEYHRMRQTINGFSYNFFVNDFKYDFEHQFLRNMLHRHNGFINGELIPYSEVGQMAGIDQSEWSWSPLFADYDNDGDKDLIIANGFPRDMTDKDWTRYQATVYGSLATAQQVIDSAPPIKVPNLSFENTGDLNFKRRHDWLPEVPSYSYGAVFTDLDLDGDLDYVTNNLNDKAFVYKNLIAEKGGNKNRYLRISLTGNGGNTMGLGAKVEVWAGGSCQFMEHFLTRGYASSVDPVMHFGMGAIEEADSVRVTWPSENVSVIYGVKTNSTLGLVESESSVNIREKMKVNNNLLFRKVGGAIGYVHQQKDFGDFFLNQKIIPHKFSQVGPAVASGDLNGDGLEDIVIGATNLLPTTVYLGNGSKFSEYNLKGLSEMKNFSESGLEITDIDQDGDNDVIAIAGGYENPEDEYVHYVYINNEGSFTRKELPVPHFPASVVKLLDYDNDGFKDIFIGARVKKGMYPYSNHSWIIKNRKGELSTNSLLRFDLGMVTDACPTDFDSDGWVDLIVARDWNSLALVKNNEGKELVAQTLPGVEELNGKWYSVAAGDFDGDGDDDLLAGNLGWNSRYVASGEYPMNMYVIDIDMDGNIDPLVTRFWNDPQGNPREFPLNYLDELWSQSSYFEIRFRKYKTFSYSDITTILDQNVKSRLQFTLSLNTLSSYAMWNEAGKFNPVELPEEIQVAPVRKLLVADINGDGTDDLIAGGNDHTFDISTGIMDASKGFVLIGRDNQTFDILEPSESGLLLNGMVESLVRLRSDTLTILAGINRSGLLIYRKN